LATNILAIESSCDETAASVCIDGRITSNVIATQEIHKKYGGVVPELASRAHMQNIMPVVREALEQAGYPILKTWTLWLSQRLLDLLEHFCWRLLCEIYGIRTRYSFDRVHHMQAHVLANLIPERRPSFHFYASP
jgi:N6-L-threonylcarbamoyladenine synthase